MVEKVVMRTAECVEVHGSPMHSNTSRNKKEHTHNAHIHKHGQYNTSTHRHHSPFHKYTHEHTRKNTQDKPTDTQTMRPELGLFAAGTRRAHTHKHPTRVTRQWKKENGR